MDRDGGDGDQEPADVQDAVRRFADLARAVMDGTAVRLALGGADDVRAEAELTVVQAYRRWEPSKAPFRPWVVLVARHRARDLLRAAGRLSAEDRAAARATAADGGRPGTDAAGRGRSLRDAGAAAARALARAGPLPSDETLATGDEPAQDHADADAAFRAAALLRFALVWATDALDPEYRRAYGDGGSRALRLVASLVLKAAAPEPPPETELLRAAVLGGLTLDTYDAVRADLARAVALCVRHADPPD